ncbi:hypothetical protein [Rhizobium sp. NPDC092017]|uniref:hypothetical protein n=1 Tax=Rhizobium sp. NPDC092017 TaxID=3364502 RepID=UPI0037F970EF
MKASARVQERYSDEQEVEQGMIVGALGNVPPRMSFLMEADDQSRAEVRLSLEVSRTAGADID